MSSSSPTAFEFDGFRLDRRRRQLRNASGARVQVTAKAFDALVFFLEHPGEVVERSTLMEALWPRAVVEENNLNQVVAGLRRAIGGGVIATIKGRGYQFVAEVRAVPVEAAGSDAPAAPSPSMSADRRWRILLPATMVLSMLAAGLFIVDQLREPRPPEPVAALKFDPFLRYAETPTENERALDFYRSARQYESYGNSESELASAGQLYERAVAEDPDFALAWARLSIAHIEHYFFGLDRTDARRALSLEAAERALTLQSGLAEAHMAMGWYRFHTNGYDDALRELEIARRGLARDAELHWRIAMVYRDLGRWVQALSAFERAAEFDPKDMGLRFAAAEAYIMLRDYDRAERYLEQTLEIMPNFVQAQNAKAMVPMWRDGDVSAAKVAADGQTFAEPGALWHWPPQYFGWQAALYERDYETALAVLDQWEDDAWFTFQYVPKAAAYAVIHELAGRHGRARVYFEAARGQVEAALASAPEETPALLIALGEALAGLGDSEGANEAAERALERAETVGDQVALPFPRLDAVLRVFLRAGDVDSALDELDAYLAEPGMWSIEGLLPDPRLDSIRDDPRFLALVDRYQRP
jgi:DNA-binding winged helix-turn-helix (wHTH) protein/tetratricopeptide (TPR) repeat protein